MGTIEGHNSPPLTPQEAARIVREQRREGASAEAARKATVDDVIETIIREYPGEFHLRRLYRDPDVRKWFKPKAIRGGLARLLRDGRIRQRRSRRDRRVLLLFPVERAQEVQLPAKPKVKPRLRKEQAAQQVAAALSVLGKAIATKQAFLALARGVATAPTAARGQSLVQIVEGYETETWRVLESALRRDRSSFGLGLQIYMESGGGWKVNVSDRDASAIRQDLREFLARAGAA